MATCTVAEGDGHAKAVTRWLDEFVIGLGFCPWAQTASRKRGIRVVSSSATSEEGVLTDLRIEAGRLSKELNPPVDTPTTTLLVCPHVASWQSFNSFQDFFVDTLDNGDALAEEFGLKLVSFHPDYVKDPFYSIGLEEGDEIEIPTSDTPVTVIDGDAGVDKEGKEIFKVRLQNGSEQIITYSALIEFLQENDGDVTNKLEEEEVEEEEGLHYYFFAQRAPRPTLHLLRLCDRDGALAGNGPDLEELAMDNYSRAFELGNHGMEEMLQRCG